MKVVNFEQGSDPWLEWRLNGITATDAIIIGASLINLELYKDESLWRLWSVKTNYARAKDLSRNPHVNRGKQFEDVARLKCEQHFNDMIIPVCIESTYKGMIRASLDGILATGEPVELKCPSEPVWLDILQKGENSAHYQRYWIQCQHQMLASGSKKSYLAFYFNDEFKVFEIEADMDFLRELFVLEMKFWQMVQNNEPPAKDPIRDSHIPVGEESSQWIYLSENYKFFDDQIIALKEQLKELEGKRKPFKEGLMAIMPDSKTVDYNGLIVTRYERQGSYDADKLVEFIKKLDPNITEDVLNSFRKEKNTSLRITRSSNDAPRNIINEEVLQPIVQKAVDYESAVF
ncbi:YqaJ viral recombinase family protein [Acinetobacter sp.]|uniref:YqaJ viral recombinase family nuclease n=1 Tax=Acinetobacter sp. TaxID=472 RepID=UPI003CFCE856